MNLRDSPKEMIIKYKPWTNFNSLYLLCPTLSCCLTFSDTVTLFLPHQQLTATDLICKNSEGFLFSRHCDMLLRLITVNKRCDWSLHHLNQTEPAEMHLTSWLMASLIKYFIMWCGAAARFLLIILTLCFSKMWSFLLTLVLFISEVPQNAEPWSCVCVWCYAILNDLAW